MQYIIQVATFLKSSTLVIYLAVQPMVYDAAVGYTQQLRRLKSSLESKYDHSKILMQCMVFINIIMSVAL